MPAWLASSCTPVISPAAEAAIAELARLPKGAERAAVLRTKLLAKQNKHEEAIAELDKLIAGYPKGSERRARPCSPRPRASRP